MEGECPHYPYRGTPLHLGDGARGFKPLCGKEISIKLIIVIFAVEEQRIHQAALPSPAFGYFT